MPEKLVRDKIPELAAAKGEDFPVRAAVSDEEYRNFLRAKLLEEIAEFFAAENDASRIEEGADIMEVIRAGAAFDKIDLADVERVRAKKYAERGGFEKRVIWKGWNGR